MPGSSNTSFIPKRNPALKEKSAGKRQVYIGTFIVRILFVAVMIATIAVFLYERKLQSTLDNEVVALSSAISSFNEAEMQRVLEVEKRLGQVQNRLDHTASMISLLRAIEASTVGSAQITALTMERISDTQFELGAELQTGSFDSVLFQRNILESNETLVVQNIEEIVVDNPPPNSASFDSERANREGPLGVVVGFQALLTVSSEAIPHTVAPATAPAASDAAMPTFETASSSPEAAVVEESVISNETI